MPDIGYDDYDDQDDDGYEPDPDDWDDRSFPREPDPEDYEIARAYEEHYEHCEQAHGGGECDCRPSLRERLAWRLRDIAGWLPGLWHQARHAARQPRTVRLGPAEITIRLRADRACGACSGRGWFWTLTPGEPKFPIPPGYNGTALCGCGSAIGQLADARRRMRRARSEPPF